MVCSSWNRFQSFSFWFSFSSSTGSWPLSVATGPRPLPLNLVAALVGAWRSRRPRSGALALALGLTLLAHAAAAAPVDPSRIKLVTRESVIARPSIRVDPATMVFSPDARHVAYAAFEGRQRTVFLDGVEHGTYEQVEAFHFSPNGNRWAFWALRDGMRQVIVDGKPGKPFNASWEWLRTVLVVTNGDLQFDEVPQNLVFSPDSRRLAYVGALLKDRKPRVVLDDEEIGLHDGLVDCGLVFSPDSRRLGYVAQQGTNCVAIVDGQPGRPYDQGVVLSPAGFSADGKRLAYFGSTGGKHFVVIDGTEVGPFDQVGMASLAFSPNGRQLAFKVFRSDQSLLWRDGREEGGFETLAGIVFSPDSQRLAYLARRAGRWLAVVDGREGKAYDGITAAVVFSPDSKRVAYGVRRGENAFVVLDGQEGRAYPRAQELRLRFSPDARYLACAVMHPEKSLIVVDGEDGPEYDAIFAFVFTGPTSMRLLARRYDALAQAEIVRAEIEIRVRD